MISHATPEQTQQLPTPQQGTSYRLRTIGRETYVTTGTFAVTAPNAELANLHRVAALIFDFDLASYLAPQLPNWSAADKQQRKELTAAVKLQLHQLPDTALDSLKAEHVTACVNLLAETAGQLPTAVVDSGYGCHAYLWLPDADGYGTVDIAAAQAANHYLIAALNSRAGIALADPQASDAGTRILRPLNTQNRKNPQLPRAVRLLDLDQSRRLLHWRSFVAAPRTLFAPAAAPVVQQPVIEGALSALFAKSESEAAEQLQVLFRNCPFFLWAQDNPKALGRESWRGAATNIAAVAGEFGRQHFHDFSKLDTDRYNPYDCDAVYTDALRSVHTHGPMTYATLSGNGDWQGSGPANVKSPAALKYLGEKTAKLVAFADVAINPKTGAPIKQPGNLRKILRNDEKFGNRVKLNLRIDKVEVDGAAISDEFFGDVGEYLEDTYDVSFPRLWVADALREVAAENSYDPVVQYLESLVWDGTDRVQQVVTEVLHAEDKPLFAEFVRCFLVSAVARALCDSAKGCKVDTAFILKGEQGARKSTFFAVLAGEFFSDSPMDLKSKDAYLQLQASWLIEWGEFEYTLNRNQVTAVKAFLSAQVDTFRPPFRREVIRAPRKCVIVGSTNEEHFLFDPTGDRRFWVIEAKDIDITLLKATRDQLWAQAVALYKAGAKWYLSADNETERSELAQQYRNEEPWESVVTRYVEEKRITDVSVEQVLLECIQKETRDWSKSDTQTVGSILRKLGFHRYRTQPAGKTKREYRYRRIGAEYPATAATLAAATNVIPIRSEIAQLFKGQNA